MESEKTNILDVLALMLLTIFAASTAIRALVGGSPIAGVIISLVSLLFAWGFIKSVRKGVRLPTRWERFRAWMTLRPIVIGVIGMALLTVLVTYGPTNIPILSDEMKIALTAGILIWVIALGYSIFRARRRYESDTQYKARIGWKETDNA